MGLSHDAFAAEPPRKGPRCSFGLIVDALSPDDLAVLTQVMADPKVSGRVIADVLTAEGFAVGEYVVNRHRRGACLCGR